MLIAYRAPPLLGVSLVFSVLLNLGRQEYCWNCPYRLMKGNSLLNDWRSGATPPKACYERHRLQSQELSKVLHKVFDKQQ